MKDYKKYLLKFVALTIIGCLITLSMNVTVFATETTGDANGDTEWTEEELKDFWEIAHQEIMDDPVDGVPISETGPFAGIVTYSVYDIPGTWIQVADGRWWYQHNDGSYTAGDWERINNRWYYFDGQGYMYVGWLNLNGTWYYMDDSGAMQTGWILWNGKYYYCCDSGAMLTGWFEANNKWYYCNESNGEWIDNTGTQMMQEALKYRGNPYVYGGNSLTTGTDCSGYVKLISAQFGYTLPRTSKAQYTSSRKVQKSDLQPGDLVFYHSSGNVYHVGFYLGKTTYNGRVYNNAMISAANTTQGICIENIWSSSVYYGTYWR